MSNTYRYLINHKLSLISFIIYYLGWFPLLMIPITNKVVFEPIIVGEFPLMPLLTIPFTIVMLVNAILRKEHKLFYVAMTILIYLPFVIISKKA